MFRALRTLPLALAAVLFLAVSPASAAPTVATGATTLKINQQLFVEALGEDVAISGEIVARALAVGASEGPPGFLLYGLDFRGVQIVGLKSGKTFSASDVDFGLARWTSSDQDISIALGVAVTPQASGMQLYFQGKLRVSGSTTLALGLQGLFSLSS